MKQEIRTEMELFILFNPGELEVAAEFSTKDSDAAGSVDFVILLHSFVISVLEVTILFCHSYATFLCIPKLGVNAVKSVYDIQWLHNNNRCIRLGRLFDYGLV